MATKVEGLVLSKVPYRERDLICHLLLRSGKKVSLLFWGGQGGGAKLKSRTLEIGNMIKVEVQSSRRVGGMCSAKEWSVVWSHDKIRLDHKAFFLLCFFVEAVSKVAVSGDLDGDDNSSEAELFGIVANGVFYLEEELKNGTFTSSAHSAVFLIKLLLNQGIMPTLSECTFCAKKLSLKENIQLVVEQGGFACADCRDLSVEEGRFVGRELLPLMAHVTAMKYQNIGDLPTPSATSAHQVFSYFCYQSHVRMEDFKSAGALF